MRRTKALARTGGPKRKKPKKARAIRGVGVAIENRRLFQDAARGQGICQAPDCPVTSNHDPHHVIYEQHLKDRGLPRYDARNALRLCRGCHHRHHFTPGWRLPTAALREENIAYAVLVLGEYAIDYFRRYYDDSADDPRIAELAT